MKFQQLVHICISQLCSILLFIAIILFEIILFESIFFIEVLTDLKALNYRVIYLLFFMFIWMTFFIYLRKKLIYLFKLNSSVKSLLISDLLCLLGTPIMYFVFDNGLVSFLIVFYSLFVVSIDLFTIKYNQLSSVLHFLFYIIIYTNIVVDVVMYQYAISKYNESQSIVDTYERYNKFVDKFNTTWSMAQYKNGKLVDQHGDYLYPLLYTFYFDKINYYSIYKADYKHYIYNCDESQYIISYQIWPLWLRYVVIFSFSFAFYLIINVIIYFAWAYFYEKKRLNSSFFSRLHSSIIIFMLSSFFILFFVALFLISYRFNQRNINEAKQKMMYFVDYMEPIIVTNQSDTLKCYETVKISKILGVDVGVYFPDGNLHYATKTDLFKPNIDVLSTKSPFYNMPLSVSVQKDKMHNILRAYSIIYNGNDKIRFFVMQIPQTGKNLSVIGLIVQMLNIFFIVILIGIIASYYISRKLVGPILEIGFKIRMMKLDKENKKIIYKSNDEIGLLISQYNNICDALQNSVKNITKIERDTSWRYMARQIAHEMKNPLTPMKLITQRIMMLKNDNQDKYKQDVNESLKLLVDEIEYLYRISASLSEFAKMPINDPVLVNVVEKLKYTIKLFSNNEANTVIDFKYNINKAMVLIEEDTLTQVLNNLFRNALQAIPINKKGRILVTIFVFSSNIYFSIEDNGDGIPFENYLRLFDVNYTTKPTGMGMGLSVSRNIIESSGGKLSFRSRRKRGTIFIISFPIYKKETLYVE